MFNLPLYVNGGFTPFGLPNLYGYWDVSNATVTGGVTVDTLPDRSGNGQDLAKVGGTGPTYTASDANFNNHPSIGSTIANRRMTRTFTAAVSQPSTWYLVMNQGSTAATNYWRTNAGNFTGSHGLSVASTAGTASMLTKDVAAAITSTGSLGAGLYVNCCVYNGAATGSAMYFNNSQTAFALYPGQGSVNDDPSTASVVTIGSFGTPYDHTWACMMVYSGLHDSATRRRVMNYLGTKYGIATT